MLSAGVTPASRLLQAALLLSKQQVTACCLAPCCRMHAYLSVFVAVQIPLETLSWRVERAQSVSTGLLQLVGLKEVDTLVCGIAGYRWAPLR